jgi:hypothetical protein
MPRRRLVNGDRITSPERLSGRLRIYGKAMGVYSGGPL